MTATETVVVMEKTRVDSVSDHTVDELAHSRRADNLLLQLQGQWMTQDLDTRAVAWCAFWIGVAVIETVLLFVLFPIK